MELTGKLISIMPKQTGQGSRGEWVRQDFLIETTEQYPRKVIVSAWGERAQELEAYKPGNTVSIDINLESREYNGRWYTDVRVWRFRKQSSDIQDFQGISDSLPQSNIPLPETPDPEPDQIDDLPF